MCMGMRCYKNGNDICCGILIHSKWCTHCPLNLNDDEVKQRKVWTEKSANHCNGHRERRWFLNERFIFIFFFIFFDDEVLSNYQQYNTIGFLSSFNCLLDSIDRWAFFFLPLPLCLSLHLIHSKCCSHSSSLVLLTIYFQNDSLKLMVAFHTVFIFPSTPRYTYIKPSSEWEIHLLLSSLWQFYNLFRDGCANRKNATTGTICNAREKPISDTMSLAFRKLDSVAAAAAAGACDNEVEAFHNNYV